MLTCSLHRCSYADVLAAAMLLLCSVRLTRQL